MPAEEAEASLIASPGGPAISPDGANVALMKMDIESVVGFKRKQWFGSVWFQLGGGGVGSAFQRIRFKPGEDGTNKIYRYSSEGVFRTVAEPGSAREAKLPPEQWSRSANRFFPFDAQRAGCPQVSEPSVLLYLISATKLSRGDQLRVCVFNKKALYHATLDAVGSEPVAVQYVRKDAGRSERVDREITALVLRLTAQPDDPGVVQIEPFEFMGLEGEIEVLVDSASGLPLRIRGELARIGRLDFKLSEVAAAEHPTNLSQQE